MGKIKILDESVSNAIAAGEVVENPTSMIKELIENSLDAGSSSIKIEVEKGGLFVKITDDGCGMSKEDLLMSTERHATSKISKKEDLFAINTYGFRGEALSSIASISKFKMISRTKEMQLANQVNLLGGKVTNLKELEANIGTTIEIKELFYNTPARLKFLRKETTEYTNIKDMILREALANPKVKISLYIEGRESISTSGNGIENTIYELFGRNTLKNIKAFNYGFVGNIELYRSNRDYIFVFVNARPVKSKIVEEAIIDAYYTKLMKNKYPFAIVFLEINPQDVDVNVHPSKKIVKFADQGSIYRTVKAEAESVINANDEFSLTEIFREDTKAVETEQEEKELYIFADEEEKKVGEFFTETYRNNTKFETLKTSELKFDDEIFNKSLDKLKEKIEKFSENTYNEKESISLTQTSSYVEQDRQQHITDDNIFDDRDIFLVKDWSKVPQYRLIGQLFDTFILVERAGLFEIYDQHIIHERILYEKLKKEYADKKLSSQALLVPIRIELNIKEKALVMENLEIFEGFGFELDVFGDSNTELLIRSVPTFNFRDSYENTIKYIIDNIMNDKDVDILENILISMSCKGAIKANHKLKYEEMYDMVAKIHEVGIFTCPHGRPIIARINLNDMEKLFKRK